VQKIKQYRELISYVYYRLFYQNKNAEVSVECKAEVLKPFMDLLSFLLAVGVCLLLEASKFHFAPCAQRICDLLFESASRGRK